MANLQETSQWAPGIYQIETTDPVVGGPDGISNIQARQLANRTQYLKEQVERVQQSITSIGEEGQNALWSAVEFALSQIGLLDREAARDRFVRHQEGEVTIYNRGVKRGCTITKSQNASRNIGITAGVIFMQGREWGVKAMDNAAAVPGNDGDASGTAYAYLALTASGPMLAVTSLNAAPPASALVLAVLTIPGGNTGITDPHLENVTITPIARLEPGWPTVQLSPPYVDHTFSKQMVGTGYTVSCDTVSWDGGERPQLAIPIANRAANAFRIYLGGMADNVRVRFVAHYMNQ